MLSKDAVLHVLSGIEDPELKKPFTELGMVKYVNIDGGRVSIGIFLTVVGCPLKDKITADIVHGVKLIPEVESVKVDFDVMSDEQREELKAKLGLASSGAGRKPPPIVATAKRFVAVASGKGGVGKSTVTANLASALARLGHRVGLLDADVYGFSIPRMLGLSGKPTALDDKLVPLRKGDNLQVISMGFFVNEDDPVIWRGPLLHKAVNQFLTDVVWDELDFLFMDLPPGTGDVTLTIAQAVPSAELLVVTTPQETATHVAGRVAKLAERTKLKVLGIIENMSYYETDGEKDYIFGQGGGRILAERLSVPFLGEIPLRKSIRVAGDEGKPSALWGSDDEVKLFESLAKRIEEAG